MGRLSLQWSYILSEQTNKAVSGQWLCEEGTLHCALLLLFALLCAGCASQWASKLTQAFSPPAFNKYLNNQTRKVSYSCLS